MPQSEKFETLGLGCGNGGTYLAAAALVTAYAAEWLFIEVFTGQGFGGRWVASRCAHQIARDLTQLSAIQNLVVDATLTPRKCRWSDATTSGELVKVLATRFTVTACT